MVNISANAVDFTASYIVIRPVATLSVMFFVYGFYTLLFIIYIRLLRHPRYRRGENRSTYYLWSNLVLFVLATVIVVLQTQRTLREALIDFHVVKTGDVESHLVKFKTGSDMLHQALTSVSFYITIVSNIVADAILIHRCYTIWQKRKRILIPLSISVFIVSVLGFTSMIMTTVGGQKNRNPKVAKDGSLVQTVYFGLDAAVNFAISLLTGAPYQVWSVSREVGDLMGASSIKKTYQRVIAIILESGILYPTIIVLHLVFRNTFAKGGTPINLFPLLTLVAGIAPTLIVVRAGLASESKDPAGSSALRFTGINTRSERDTIETENEHASSSSTRTESRFSSKQCEVLGKEQV
ncbi:hypothetical protein E1B28_000284 [Marasmius oreades]|uniref:Uncharacterized protein n=1 Tax=Marasmius oreades TaxID=181124 RepID=A0A9P8AEA8_9AGAR|nr:uncharacterized protein E1B28_000284 [Marasmius oreades]KAG7098323.1 hypothetical protein E1B28_000284 [Marasmius oreades]